jgi:putative membrane protein
MRHWSASRLTTAAVGAAWAGAFWYVILSGRVTLYLSPRTTWLAPLGAILITAAVLGYLRTVRVDEPEPLTARHAGGILLLLVPILVLASMPALALGSFATSRRASFVGTGVVATDTSDLSEGDLSLLDITGALATEEGRRALRERAGTESSFVGFVDRSSSSPADEFLLSRFVVSCCAADALATQVRVVNAPPGRFKVDEWVRVTGDVYPLGEEVILDASEVVTVPRPKHPYLSP